MSKKPDNHLIIEPLRFNTSVLLILLQRLDSIPNWPNLFRVFRLLWLTDGKLITTHSFLEFYIK